MVEEGVEHVPVLEGGRLVGICTRSDLLRVRAAQQVLEHRQPGLAATLGRVRRTG
jgi:CBS domain-containing protein